MVRTVEPQVPLDELALFLAGIRGHHKICRIAGSPGKGEHNQRNDKEKNDALQKPVEDVFLQIPDLKGWCAPGCSASYRRDKRELSRVLSIFPGRTRLSSYPLDTEFKGYYGHGLPSA